MINMWASIDCVKLERVIYRSASFRVYRETGNICTKWLQRMIWWMNELGPINMCTTTINTSLLSHTHTTRVRACRVVIEASSATATVITAAAVAANTANNIGAIHVGTCTTTVLFTQFALICTLCHSSMGRRPMDQNTDRATRGRQDRPPAGRQDRPLQAVSAKEL